ncbi:MAG TPA: polysaccharide biosynthesis protein [Thermoanaerobacterales bacterium]|nr:polysaccharide biosynthesis protein [Thermoanaerobacterales bacterium]
MVILDIGIINISLYLSLALRFDNDIPMQYFVLFKETYLMVTVIALCSFLVFNLYNRIWKYASIDELISIVLATSFSSLTVLGYTFMMRQTFPRSIYILYWLLLTTFIGGSRFVLRTFNGVTPMLRKKEGVRNVMVIGAGEAGSMVIQEFKKHPDLKMRPIVIIDDDENKHNMRIHGVKVFGGRYDIPELVLQKNIKEIIIAMPSIDRHEIREIVNICSKTKCKLRIVPGVYELLDGKVSIKRLRDVKIEDLLGRAPIKVNLEEISGYIQNKAVLVTGGGGSIGSELCRQIARFEPKELIVFDISENNVYSLEFDLKTLFPDIKYTALIGSVRDRERLEYIFEQYRPNVVFHAAAHKHVPLMELNATEAIKNNVFGTLNVAETADKYNAERFTLISTDKAVNPTNIMGASKRIAEIIIQMMSMKSKTVFSAVRFGNVLGSDGSVIPLFRKQIESGGPVTVTHPEVIRYFMTIPEAVQLVIQAGALAKGGEIFILDMGEPVKIADLARDMIKLSGLEPDVDIKIDYIGLRPGEKLFEELLLNEEGITATKYKKIFIAKPTFTDVAAFESELGGLKELLLDSNTGVKDMIKKIVPTYKDNNEVIKKAE